MIVIHIARKPLSEQNLARNVLKHSTGALHVDAVRIGAPPPSVPMPQFNSPTGRIYGMKTGEGRTGEMSQSTKGRWPPNMILEHDPRCQCTGTYEVPGHLGYPNGPGGNKNRVALYDFPDPQGWAQKPLPPSGPETVQAWDCVPDCPVRKLEAQGEGRSAYPGNPEGADRVQGTPSDPSRFVVDFGVSCSGLSYTDTGTVARYFLQVQPKPL